MSTAGQVIAAFHALPSAGLPGLLGGARAMILAPHPDDESLGCGGLIAEACRLGQPPLVVILTDGAASHPRSKRYPLSRLRRLRADEARAATARLGLPPDHLAFLGYPDTALPATGASLHEAAGQVAALARRFGCGAIIAPWRHDPHCDHESAAAIGREAARLTGARLLSYPVWGWLLPPDTPLPEDEVRGWKLDISAHLAVKQQAIAAHASQYSDLIDDSPEGFRLPRGLLSVFEQPFEVFIVG
jgi:LmbE family N-acetylglucosaminyl deacetylase